MPGDNGIQMGERTRTRHSPIGAFTPYTDTTKSFTYTFPEQSLITEIGLNNVSDQHSNIAITISVKKESVELFKAHLKKKEIEAGKKTEFKYDLLNNKFCFRFNEIKQNLTEQDRLWELLKRAKKFSTIKDKKFSTITFDILNEIGKKLEIPSPFSLVGLCTRTIDRNNELSKQAREKNILPEELASSLSPPEKKHAFPPSFEKKYIDEKIKQNLNNGFATYL